MSASTQSLSTIPTCYATVSIGTPSTPLPEKLHAIASAGWQGIELGFPDLLTFSSQSNPTEVDAKDYVTLCENAKHVKRICALHSLKIVMLQPFSNFEGWPSGSSERKDAFERAQGWIKIMQALGCTMLQVGSSDSPNMVVDREPIVSDLRELSGLLAEHDFYLAYENWCWSTHAPDWKDVWQIVEAVDRPNIGLCLDTFQTAGGEWADPTTASGLIEGEGLREMMERTFQESLNDLGKRVPKDKIYILQVSDAYNVHLNDQLDEGSTRPRGQWSGKYRPPPFQGGYLPVTDVTKAVLMTGFRGWFSMEVFDGGPTGEGSDWKDMTGYARKAMRAHHQLLEACVEEDKDIL